MHNLITTIALASALASAPSLPADSAAAPDCLERTLLESRREMQPGEEAFSNPALMPWRQDYSLGSVSAGWRSRRESEPFTVETGHGEYAGFFDARAYHRSGSSTLWGEAAYDNGKRLGQRWNESGDFERLYPYLTADSAGGDLNRERYAFLGGYAHAGRRLTWGAEGGYTAILSYRKADPRPRDITGDLTLRAAIGYRLPLRHVLAVAATFNKFRASSSIAFMSELGVSKLYHLTGLGSHYVRFAGTGATTYNDCHSWEAALNLLPEGNSGALLNALFSLTSQHHVLEDLNRLPMASLTHKETSVSAGWRQQLGRHRLTLLAGVRIYRRHGTETIFGDPTSGTYPEIGTLGLYADNFHSESLTLLWEYTGRTFALGARPYASLLHRRTVYLSPRRDRLINTASAGIRLYADCRMSRRMAGSLAIDASRRFGRHSFLSIPPGTDSEEQDLAAAVATDFRNASCSATLTGASIRLSYGISPKYAAGVSASIGYTSLETSPHSLAWQVAADFSF